MELAELEQRLGPFCQYHYDDPSVSVADVFVMPGHAGFAYGFSAESRGRTQSWFLRLPPPNVNWRGTADVLRQVQVLNALDNTEIPHCSVKWSGDDLQWFGRPYFIVPQLQGDIVRNGPGEWAENLDTQTAINMARQFMSALASIHKLSWREVTPGLGPAIAFEEDVTRWDRFFERAADPQELELAPLVREGLLANVPVDAPVGIFHGDFQIANLFFSPGHQLLAVIDWELVGIGATLNDVGWICTFSDRQAWANGTLKRPMFLDPETLVALYTEAYGEALPDLNWFRALAAYKFAIITGFNLSLHRRGKRHDPTWEITRLSMRPLIERALQLLPGRGQ
jgi:aminoglycoside phosphotransferase (APT) family kinase protein